MKDNEKRIKEEETILAIRHFEDMMHGDYNSKDILEMFELDVESLYTKFCEEDFYFALAIDAMKTAKPKVDKDIILQFKDKIFDYLDVLPNEEFYIKSKDKLCGNLCRITSSMKLQFYVNVSQGNPKSFWNDSAMSVFDFIDGEYELVKYDDFVIGNY